jgi:hypothetical protein
MVLGRAAAALLVASTGCSLFLDSGDSGDSGDAGAARDATLRDCPIPPGLLADINALGEVDDPTLSPDGLELFFEHDDDLYLASRSSRKEVFSTPSEIAVAVDGLNGPRLSSDGLQLWFHTGSPNNGDATAYRLSRQSLGESFGSLEEVSLPHPTINEELAPAAIVVRGDGPDRIYGSSEFSIYTGTLGASFARIDLLPGDNRRETNPWVGEGDELFFVSNDDGSELDIWRTDVDRTLVPDRVPGASSPTTAEEDPWFDPACGHLYFARRGAGDRQLEVIDLRAD